MLTAPDLSVPGSSSRLVAEVELHPSKVEQWLASLPLLNLAQGGGKLYTTLSAYNRIDIDPLVRLQLLELYRGPVRHVAMELQKQYVGSLLPLPEKNKKAAEQNREFQLELAYGYKYVVLAHARRPGIRLDIAQALQRAIHHLTEVLLTAYLSYSPPTPRLWREIHALYAYAESIGAADTVVTDALNAAREQRSVAETYKHALLLDLSDPYHLPSRMIVKINQYLEAYAALATLHRGFERVEPNCHFLVDLESDRAGLLYSADMTPADSNRYCLLNTVTLARHIHGQLTYFRSGVLPPCESLPAAFYRSGGEEMLMRLINVWGLNPRRVFRRNPRQGTAVDIAVGLDAVNYWFNGAHRFVLSAELVGPWPQRTNIGVFAKTHEEAKNAADYEHEAWELQDESAGGVSLRKIGLIRRRVKVGDLIAMRFERGEAWTVAVVRWIRSPNSSNVEIGTQRLAASAIPVVTKIVADDNTESDFLPSLFLPAVAALNEPQSLVTPCNVFRADRVIYLDDGRKLSRLRAKQLIEVASGFERIEFEVDSPQP
jgi:cyclic-di-GMP-binding protein